MGRRYVRGGGGVGSYEKGVGSYEGREVRWYVGVGG